MLLTRENIYSLNESKSYNIGDIIWIHFPYTEDLVQCIIKNTFNTKVLLGFNESSDYYGCPDFYFTKLNIVGKVN